MIKFDELNSSSLKSCNLLIPCKIIISLCNVSCNLSIDHSTNPQICFGMEFIQKFNGWIKKNGDKQIYV